MIVAFKDKSFAFEFIRNFGFTYYGGADIGDMMATAPEVVEGDFESWFTAWDKRARRILARADQYASAGHATSAREAYLRASTYFRMAEFYLHGDPADPRILNESRASQQAYAKAANLSGGLWERIDIPYQGTTMPGYFYKVDNSGKPRPTLIFHGGYDSSKEELGFYGGIAAARRGYNCLTFDGPGQGAPIREEKIPFRYDWEKVVTPAVNFALQRPDIDSSKLALMGMSLGGYLAARTVAFETRFKAAIFFDGVFDCGQWFEAMVPKPSLDAFKAGDPEQFEKLIQNAMKSDTNLRWFITQGLWTFDLRSIADLYGAFQQMTMEGITGNIECPCLVMEAGVDMFFRGQPEQIYDQLKSQKEIVRFTAEDGAENHCQSGALSLKDEVVFNWLDQVLTPE